MPMLDSVLDYVSVELLGCALPRQKRPQSSIPQPRSPVAHIEVDRSIEIAPRPGTWSNGYEGSELRSNPSYY